MFPTVESLKSSRMTRRFGEMFNPPGLTNFIGCVQVEIDPVAIRSHNYPPFDHDGVTAKFFWDDHIFGSQGTSVHITWYPDRIEREAEFGAFHVSTTTAMAIGRLGTVIQIRVHNRGAERGIARFKLVCRGGVTKSTAVWKQAYAPTESDNETIVDEALAAIVFKGRNSESAVAQGAFPRPARVTPQALYFELPLVAGERKSVAFASALASTPAEALDLMRQLTTNAAAEIQKTRDDWNRELEACFTPGNDRYSGFMPTLETADADVLKNYHMGVLGTIYHKRTSPWSVYGRTYSTVMPRYWSPAGFLWDYSLSSMVHALLDPAEMRSALGRWMKLDIHKHFGTDYLTGEGIGPWYAVNDYAMTTIASHYLRYHGDADWLDTNVGGKHHTVVEYLRAYATNYRQFLTKNGLADYGGLLNLLECVGSYVHEVASLNAANVYSLRAVADIVESLRGDSDVARQMRDEALALIGKVNELYVTGKGYWNVRSPDGTLRECRHCYDLLTVLNSFPAELTSAQREEMTRFFSARLKTPTWMIALDAGDDDCVFDVRADHQWTGAYPAWPPMTALGLYKIGQGAMAFDWYKAMAKSANQGPFAQAHFGDSVMPPEDGGAMKAPPEHPHIIDWTSSSCGSWSAVVVEGIFGVQAGLKNITATPAFFGFDRDSRLTNLRHHGKLYTVDRSGLSPQPQRAPRPAGVIASS